MFFKHDIILVLKFPYRRKHHIRQPEKGLGRGLKKTLKKQKTVCKSPSRSRRSIRSRIQTARFARRTCRRGIVRRRGHTLFLRSRPPRRPLFRLRFRIGNHARIRSHRRFSRLHRRLFAPIHTIRQQHHPIRQQHHRHRNRKAHRHHAPHIKRLGRGLLLVFRLPLLLLCHLRRRMRAMRFFLMMTAHAISK